MADIKATSLGGVPKGTTAQRPTSPAVGDVFYNGTLGCLEIYTSQGWVANSAPPGIPVIGTATYSATNQAYNNASASIPFTPGEGGGLPNSYRATSTPGGFTGTAASSPITVSGLQSATAYTFSVTGTNNFGTSASSSNSNSITANTVPQSPTIGTATDAVTNGTVYVTFTTNASGGSTITNYKYSVDGTTYIALSPAQTTSPLTISGLTNNSAITVRIKAVNANGDSIASSASSSVTPTYAVPVESLVIAGGGGGAAWVGAGGGAGGLIYTAQSKLFYTTQYAITVGAGGNRTSSYTGGFTNGTNGVNSTFNNLTAIGGGVGGGYGGGFGGITYYNGSNGGSGGGATNDGAGLGSTPGSGTQPSSASGGYGNNGGTGVGGDGAGAGGGGAGGVGGSALSAGRAGNGGIGLNTWSAWATATSSGDSGYFAGGGGGGGDSSAGTAGAGGGGAGSMANAGVAGSGTSNTGGGGGGARNSGGPSANQGGIGGSGIVILRYPDTYPDPTSYPSGTKYSSGGYKYFKFTATGSITF
jgi:hypothetical protein